ncbi:MAG: hypothetical protein K0S72_2206 [Arthrobacter sp.]|nr:hypothetical protein [Arthrobacter sp.]
MPSRRSSWCVGAALLTGRWHTVTVYAITCLRAWQTDPALLAGWIRGHWKIEVRREVALVE